jgi:hypothetical protein
MSSFAISATCVIAEGVMNVELDDAATESIRRYARGALIKADAMGVVPVPLDQVSAALRFASPTDLFDLGGLSPGLRERIGRLKDKVLGALDIREHVIYLDRDQRAERQRFHHGHELGHFALPWHEDAYYGDDWSTLDPDTVDELESEATQFGVELIFGIDGFRDQAAQYRVGLGAPLELAESWELSRTATIRRYVQTSPRACGLLVIGRIPGRERVRVLKSFESPTFRQRHGFLSRMVPAWLSVDEHELAAAAMDLLRNGGVDPIVSGEFTVPGGPRLRYELTSNSYRLFALVFDPSLVSLGRRVKPIWTPAAASSASGL